MSQSHVCFVLALKKKLKLNNVQKFEFEGNI